MHLKKMLNVHLGSCDAEPLVTVHLDVVMDKHNL